MIVCSPLPHYSMLSGCHPKGAVLILFIILVKSSHLCNNVAQFALFILHYGSTLPSCIRNFRIYVWRKPTWEDIMVCWVISKENSLDLWQQGDQCLIVQCTSKANQLHYVTQWCFIIALKVHWLGSGCGLLLHCISFGQTLLLSGWANHRHVAGTHHHNKIHLQGHTTITKYTSTYDWRLARCQ